jgi:hypothetical protein
MTYSPREQQMNYTDIATLERYGDFRNATEDQRAELERLISVASELIDNYCDRVFAIADGAAMVTKTFSHENGLMEYPVSTLWLPDDLQAGYTTPLAIGSPTVTTIPETAPYNRLCRDDYWEDPTTVVGHWAYSMTTPASIEQACLRLATSMYPQVSATGERFNPMIPSDVKSILDPFRRRQMP